MTRIVLDAEVTAPSEIRIEGDEHHYLSRVRRHRAGDVIEVRDGDGRIFLATVGAVERERAVLSVTEEVLEAYPVFPVTLIVAVPKRNLMDDVVRKVSEIGVARLIPARCERSVAQPSPEKTARWRRIAAESLRQCGRRIPLTVDAPAAFDAALASVEDAGTRLILHPDPAGRPFPTAPAPPLVVAVGPEGGFSNTERRIASAAGFQTVRLTMPILRIETAAIACAVLSAAALGAL